MDYPVSVPNVSLLNGKFTDGNPAGGVPASLDPSQWSNQVTDEMLNIIMAAGFTPSETDNFQLGKAIQQGALNYGVDSGAANAYVVAFDPAITTLSAGTVLRFKAINANTGATTLNVGTGPLPVLGMSGSALQGGEIAAASTVAVVYVGAAGFVLLSTSGGALPVGPGTKGNHAVNLGQFANSLQPNGYHKLPGNQGNLIIQWGTATTGSTGQATFTYPIAFPNAVLNVVGQYFVNVAIANIASIYSQQYTNNAAGALVVNTAGTGVSGAQVKFIALGY